MIIAANFSVMNGIITKKYDNLTRCHRLEKLQDYNILITVILTEGMTGESLMSSNNSTDLKKFQFKRIFFACIL